MMRALMGQVLRRCYLNWLNWSIAIVLCSIRLLALMAVG